MDKNYDKYNAIWQEIISALEESNKISASFIERVAFDNLNGKKLIVASTSNFTSSYFEKSKNFINEKLKEFSHEDLTVEFITKSIDYVDNLKTKKVEESQEIEKPNNDLVENEIDTYSSPKTIVNTNINSN